MATPAFAHDVNQIARDKLANGNWLDFTWVGAEHMLTGYDHLLFLLGVVFFLNRLTDILKFITAFTLGHTIILLGSVLSEIQITVSPYLIDAIIAVTVMYKGFENLNGFNKLLGFQTPSLITMVFIFGLIHGLGLAARFQGLIAADDPGLFAKILCFNLGVELGQVAALLVMIFVIRAWRKTYIWQPLSRTINSLLVITGFVLMLFQLHGLTHQQMLAEHGHTPSSSAPSTESSGWHSHGDGVLHKH